MSPRAVRSGRGSKGPWTAPLGLPWPPARTKPRLNDSAVADMLGVTDATAAELVTVPNGEASPLPSTRRKAAGGSAV